MTFAVCNIEPSVFHVVDKPVFIVDAATVFSLQVACERLWLSDSFHAAVTFDILNELVDAF